MIYSIKKVFEPPQGYKKGMEFQMTEKLKNMPYI